MKILARWERSPVIRKIFMAATAAAGCTGVERGTGERVVNGVCGGEPRVDR